MEEKKENKKSDKEKQSVKWDMDKKTCTFISKCGTEVVINASTDIWKNSLKTVYVKAGGLDMVMPVSVVKDISPRVKYSHRTINHTVFKLGFDDEKKK